MIQIFCLFVVVKEAVGNFSINGLVMGQLEWVVNSYCPPEMLYLMAWYTLETHPLLLMVVLCVQKVELEKVKKARLERERERAERNDLEELEQRLVATFLFYYKNCPPCY